jgi:DNA-binding transcriptional MerR regulator
MPPPKTYNNEKKYWTIGEVASVLNISTSKIRFWERYFDISIDKRIASRVRGGGERRYNEEESTIICAINWFENTDGRQLWKIKEILKELKII